MALDLGDRRSAAMALNNLGVIDLREGRPAEALPRFEQARELRREIGDERGAAATSLGLCESLVRLGRCSRGHEALAEGLEFAVGAGDAQLLVSVVETAAMVALGTGEEDTARLLLAAAMAERKTLGSPRDPFDDVEAVDARLGPLPAGASVPSIADAIVIARRLAQRGTTPPNGE